MEPDFPIECLISGTPRSLQASNQALVEWRRHVSTSFRQVVPPEKWATERPVAVTIYHFPEVQMAGDIDNIVKPILDSLSPFIYIDDHQVDRVVVQRFDPGRVYKFPNPSDRLREALEGEKPLTYVAVSDDPFEDLR